MKLTIIYRESGKIIRLPLLAFLLLLLPFVSISQKTDDDKLKNTERTSPAKMNNSKVKTEKNRKTKGNPNKKTTKVKKSDPGRWDWGKIMWFKTYKGRYETNNGKNGKQSEVKKQGELAVDLKPANIPYDPKIAGKGKQLRKRNKTPDKPDEDNILFKKSKSKRKPNDNDKLKTASARDYDDLKKPDQNKLLTLDRDDKKRKADDDKKLMNSELPNYKKGKPDYDKLKTASIKDEKPKYDNDKLKTVTVRNEKPKYDNDKLKTSTVRNEKPKYDNDKLKTSAVKDKPKPYNSEDIMKPLKKIERPKFDSDKLMTVKQEKSPSATARKSAEDIASYSGDYVIPQRKKPGYHPSSRYLAAERHSIPWLKRTQQDFSMFWSKVWKPDLQPNYVNDKKPKLKRDKKEGQIWDNTVHPSEWQKTPEEAESGESSN